jgi:aldehyde dehydrogenase (NAD+)
MNHSLLPQLQAMQAFFATGATRDYNFRKEQLLRLKGALYAHEEELYAALYTDLKKNKEESWVTELGFVVGELNNALKKLKGWMKPQRVGTNLLNLPSKSYILQEPLGVVLVIGTWNYPLQLLLNPVVGAIAAGNCVVLKPSEFAPATAAVIQKIVNKTFEPNYVLQVQGEGAVVIPEMMKAFRFDHVFYTGSTAVGKSIYQMAAEQLVPVTLELGGKSPCIVEADTDIEVSAKRIALTKFSNAGQMCVAPDYLLVHESIKEPFLKALKQKIEQFYIAEEEDYHYGKIVNERQFHRLKAYLQEGQAIMGGRYDESRLHIEPTLLVNVAPDARVMQEEIFGPLLPVITWIRDEEVYDVIRRHNNPLALYVFTSSDAKAEKWTSTIPFGGGCINNASWHLTNHNLPFGGRGNSGMGNYHGKYSFDTFSHAKGIMKTPTWFDPAMKYPPFKGKLNLFKKIIK